MPMCMVTSLEKKQKLVSEYIEFPLTWESHSWWVRVEKKFHPFCNVFGRKTTRFKSRLTCPHAFSDVFVESLKMSKFNVFAVVSF